MTDPGSQTHSRWCILVADAVAPDWLVSEDSDAHSAPVQYCGLGEPTTMLQKALHRARRISAATRILVTAAQALRSHWPSALWFIPTDDPFLSETTGWSSLTTAAAGPSIAPPHPSTSLHLPP